MGLKSQQTSITVFNKAVTITFSVLLTSSSFALQLTSFLTADLFLCLSCSQFRDYNRQHDDKGSVMLNLGLSTHCSEEHTVLLIKRRVLTKQLQLTLIRVNTLYSALSNSCRDTHGHTSLLTPTHISTHTHIQVY